jgi:thioredoxin
VKKFSGLKDIKTGFLLAVLATCVKNANDYTGWIRRARYKSWWTLRLLTPTPEKGCARTVPKLLSVPFESVWAEVAPTREEIESLPGITLLEFGAEWCPHCQAVQPLLKERLGVSSVRHLKIADGKGKRLGREFKVKLWPNFVLLKMGGVSEQLARPELSELELLLRNADASTKS